MCVNCGFNTDNKTGLSRHLLTASHSKTHNMDTLDTLKPEYICNCGKKYKFSQGLSKHKNVCFLSQNKKTQKTQKTQKNILVESQNW